MNIKCTDVFFLKHKLLSFLSFGFFMMMCHSANAVLINFDELDPSSYVRPDEDESIMPLTNEYESQGLLFVGAAYLVTYQEWSIPVSQPNYVAGPGFDLEFVGENLPTYVSFYLGSGSQAAVEISVKGPDYFKFVTSSGEIHGMTDYYGTPYIPNEFFSFYSATGISSVSFSGQHDNYIDDLTYTYGSHTQVPEPSTFILLLMGVAGLLGSRFKFGNQKFKPINCPRF